MVLEQEPYPQVRAARADFEAWADSVTEHQWDAARTAPDPNRWRTPNVRPLKAAERTVERVWLEKPGSFRSLAQAPIAQRIEDNQPVPMTAHDPIIDDLTALINDEIARNPPADPELPF